MQKLLKHFTFSKELNLLFLSIFLFATAMGINFVTFPAILSANGIDAGRIGIAMSFDIFAGILISFFLSKIVSKFGAIFVLFLSSSLYASSIAIMYFYQSFHLWLIFCFIMGSCWFIYTIIRITWLNSLAPDAIKGVVLGVFSAMISAGVFLGPIIVNFSGAKNYSSFLISSTLVICAFLILLPIKNSIKINFSSKRIPLKEFFKNNPRCFLGRFFLDVMTYSLLLFSVIFGQKIGLTAEKSGLLITTYMASGFCDLLVGFLLKKHSPYKLINIGFLGCLSCFLIIIFYHNSYLFLLIMYFIFGIFIACIFVSVFTITNRDYPKDKLIAANSTFQFIGSIGSISAALIAGYLTNIFGVYGLPFTIVFSCISYLTFLIIFEKKHVQNKK